jgi:serine/threonine protein kinase
MTFEAGTRLGPYEILSPIGVGGMGEVYRARDPRLGRDVAVKVLPRQLATDPERLARFEREARAASRVSDAHVVAVFDVGHEGDVAYLVTELIQGSDLRATLEGGRLSVASAIELAAQIAGGLAAAHDSGIVHRDLKPENILLTAAGIAKIADFGLAKPRGDGPASLQSGAETVTSYTEPGVVMGTVDYMAPEQVRGLDCDPRTDIFSLGCVLFELLTGRRPFRRETAAETMTAILNSDPQRSERDAPIPPALEAILRHCLEKRPEQRFQSARDLAFALRALAAPGDATSPASRAFSPTTRSTLPLPPGTRLAGNAPPALAISRDGAKVAFVAITDEGASHLYVGHLDRGEMQRVPESDFAQGPFFSPDGAWVAFAVDVSPASPRPPELRKHSFSTGLTQSVCSVADYGGGCWAEDGAIYFIGDVADGVLRVAPGAGSAERFLGQFRVGDATLPRCLGFPRLVPGESAALVLDWDASFLGDLSVVDFGSGELTSVAHAGATGASAGPGHVLHTRTDGTLIALPFDSIRNRPCGPAVAVLKDVALDEAGGVFAVSETGTLVYARGQLRGSVFEIKQLVRIRNRGEVEALPFPPEILRGRPSLSPDGRRVVVASRSNGIWIYDLTRRTRARLPAGSTRVVHFPIWCPDGKSVVYRAARVGEMGWSLVRQSADGGGEPEELIPPGPVEYRPRGFLSDGKTLLVEAATGADAGVWGLPIDVPATPRRLMAGIFGDPRPSPDGRFVAYESGDFGSIEVFVQRLEDRARREQVSVAGGRSPLWSRDGRRLFYRHGDEFFASALDGESGELVVGPPERLFECPNIEDYEVSPDGEGFLGVAIRGDSGVVRRLELVTGWFSELDRLAPSRGR